MNRPPLSAALRGMRLPSALLASKPLNLALGLLMAWAWAMFCYAHVLGFQRSGDWSYLLFSASESLTAVLFLIRSEPARVSSSLLDWALAIGATFAPFLLTPSGDGWLPSARLLIVAGVLIQITGLLSLNRSFGLVAASRQIKTGGLYALVRHPLYASYLLSYTGYLLTNSSLKNAIVGALAAILLLCRLHREERFLAQDPLYRSYMQRVPFRVLPWLY